MPLPPYHFGSGLFWPADIRNPRCRFGRGDAETVCLVLTALALVGFAWTALQRSRSSAPENDVPA